MNIQKITQTFYLAAFPAGNIDKHSGRMCLIQMQSTNLDEALEELEYEVCGDYICYDDNKLFSAELIEFLEVEEDSDRGPFTYTKWNDFAIVIAECPEPVKKPFGNLAEAIEAVTENMFGIRAL